MSLIGTYEQIEKILNSNTDYVYKQILIETITNKTKRDSEEPLIKKCSTNLFKFIASKQVVLSKDSEKNAIRAFTACEAMKKYKEMVYKNYQYYYINRIEFKSKKVSEIITEINEYAYNKGRPITKGFARLLLERYFYKDYEKTKTLDEIYDQLLKIMITPWTANQFLYTQRNNYFDGLATNLINHIKAYCSDGFIDEEILVICLLKSNKFTMLNNINDNLKIDARYGIYSDTVIDFYNNEAGKTSIEEKSNHTSEKPKEKEHTKDIYGNPIKKESIVDLLQNIVVDNTPSSKPQPTTSVNKPKKVIVEAPKQEIKVKEKKSKDPLGDFLKGLPKNKKIKKDPVVEALLSMEQDIEKYISDYNTKYTSINIDKVIELDDEIEDIIY